MSDASERADVAIIGGGPAGSVCAALLRRRDPDRRVVVLEKEPFPRHHVGESLIPGVAPILARAGILESLERWASAGDGVYRKAGIVYHWGSDASRGTWTADLREGGSGPAPVASYHVDRATFDARLLDHAEALGAIVHREARVESIQDTGRGHMLTYVQRGAEHTIETEQVIDASGLARVMARQRKEQRVGFDDMSNYALFGYWRRSRKKEQGEPLPADTYWTFVSTTEDGWCWHIPLGPDLTSVGLVTTKDALPRGAGEGSASDDLEAFYLRNVRACHGIGELLAEAELDRHPLAIDRARLHVVRDWSSYAEKLSGERHLLIGDAAVFVDPILTTGIVLSIVGASLAASLLHTLWRDPDVDPALLRTSFDETYLDLAAGYHRVAQVWYRNNDKVASWWWNARRTVLRSGLPSSSDDSRSFLAMSLGLVRDPFAGQAAVRPDGIDVVRPDKLLFAHGLLGAHDASEAVERSLALRLAEIASRDRDELAARLAVHQHLVARWRRRLERPLDLDHLEVRSRDRYYADRTMPAWQRTRFVELRPRGSTDLLARVVLPLDTDPSMPLGVPLTEPTLRASIEHALAERPIAEGRSRRRVEQCWERLAQLDVLDLLPVLDDAPSAPVAADVLASLSFVARTLVPIGDVIGVCVDLLGRGFDVIGEDLRLLVVPAAVRREERSYARTALFHVSYLDLPLGPAERLALDRAIESLRRAEHEGDPRVQRAWDEPLRALAGEAFLLTATGLSPTTPDRARAVRASSRVS